MKFALVKNLKASWLLLMVGIDVIVCGILSALFYLDSIEGAIAIIYIFLFSMFLYAVMFHLKEDISFYFFMNIIFAPAILFAAIFLSVFINYKLKYEEKRFSVGVKNYGLYMEKKREKYTLYEIIDNDDNHQKRLINGTIVKKDEITFLPATNYRLMIHGDTLFGFPKSDNRAILTDK